MMQAYITSHHKNNCMRHISSITVCYPCDQKSFDHKPASTTRTIMAACETPGLALRDHGLVDLSSPMHAWSHGTS